MSEEQKKLIFVPSEKSQEVFEKAKKLLVGGVNSPVRAFGLMETIPIYIKKGKGSKLYSIDNEEYIDYVNGWGSNLLGHASLDLQTNLIKEIENGFGFGAVSLIELKIAELIQSYIPSIELIRMVNSGTEATMSAIRLARGYTGKQKIIQFEGSYHGHADVFLVKAGSGLLTSSISKSAGLCESVIQDTLVASYNDIDSVKEYFKKYKNQIAAVIIEPISGNMGCVPAKKTFLKELRELTENESSLLIFDEVITGFRVALNGAQGYYGIRPDITCLGKIIGGGLPIGAYGGRKDIMENLSPLGDVYQAGTLSGNSLVLRGGYSVLKSLNPSFYDHLEKKSKLLEDGIRDNLKKVNKKWILNRVGSMFTLFFKEGEKIESYKDLADLNLRYYKEYFKLMLARNIYMPPSQYECHFLTAGHSQKDIEITLKHQYEVLKEMIS